MVTALHDPGKAVRVQDLPRAQHHVLGKTIKSHDVDLPRCIKGY